MLSLSITCNIPSGPTTTLLVKTSTTHNTHITISHYSTPPTPVQVTLAPSVDCMCTGRMWSPTAGTKSIRFYNKHLCMPTIYQLFRPKTCRLHTHRPHVEPNSVEHDDGVEGITVQRDGVIRPPQSLIGGVPAHFHAQIHADKNTLSVIVRPHHLLPRGPPPPRFSTTCVVPLMHADTPQRVDTRSSKGLGC